MWMPKSGTAKLELRVVVTGHEMLQGGACEFSCFCQPATLIAYVKDVIGWPTHSIGDDELNTAFLVIRRPCGVHVRCDQDVVPP